MPHLLAHYGMIVWLTHVIISEANVQNDGTRLLFAWFEVGSAASRRIKQVADTSARPRSL
jgi:hypothetical protein